MLHTVPFLGLLLAGPLGNTAPQGRGDTLAVQVDAIMAEWAKPGSPGCAVGVVRDGALVLARGYGQADLERGVPITPASVLRHRLDLEAVHGGGHRPPGAGGEAVARRRRPPVRARAAALRGAHHHPPPAAPHERAARLHRPHGARGLADGGLDDGRAGAGHDRPAEGAELQAGRGVPVLQLGLLPARRHRGPRRREAASPTSPASGSSSRWG